MEMNPASGRGGRARRLVPFAPAVFCSTTPNTDRKSGGPPTHPPLAPRAPATSSSLSSCLHVGKVLERGHATCLPLHRSGNLSGRVVLSLVQLTKTFQACLPTSPHPHSWPVLAPSPSQAQQDWEFGGGGRGVAATSLANSYRSPFDDQAIFFLIFAK